MKQKRVICSSCGGRVVFVGNREGQCEHCQTTYLKQAEQGEIEVKIKRVPSMGEGQFKFSLAFADGAILPFAVDRTVEYKTNFVDNTVTIQADGTFLNKRNFLLGFSVKDGVKSVYIELDRKTSMDWNASGEGFSSLEIRKLSRKETKASNKLIKQLAIKQFD